MTGGIMPKLSAMRWPIGITVVLVLIAGVSLSWGDAHPSRVVSPLAAISAFFTVDERGSEIRELQFLEAALHRLDGELRQRAGGGGVPSLQTEHEAVLLRVREVASRVPADSLPPDIRRLIEPEPEPAPTITSALTTRSIQEAAPVRAVSELQIGLRPPSLAADFSSLSLAAQPPWPIFLPRQHARRAAPAAPATVADPVETRPASP
jgi:hypothetical protein